MNTNFLLSATLLGVALLGGCQSTDPTTGTTSVSGQVVTYKTNKPVPNPWVQVYHQSRMGGYLAQGQPVQGDAQGKFSFAFDATDKYGYIAMATADPGYFTDWAAAAQLKAGRANEGVIIAAYAPAWYKIQLVNSSKQKIRQITISGGYYNGIDAGGTTDTFRNPKDTVLVLSQRN